MKFLDRSCNVEKNYEWFPDYSFTELENKIKYRLTALKGTFQWYAYPQGSTR